MAAELGARSLRSTSAAPQALVLSQHKELERLVVVMMDEYLGAPSVALLASRAPDGHVTFVPTGPARVHEHPDAIVGADEEAAAA
jgi:hypothetical protein